MQSTLLILLALLSWSALLVLSRVILLATGLDPWLFTFIQMMAGGAFLILISGRLSGVSRLMKDPLIWLYGVLRVGTAAFFTAALVYTTTANAAFMSVLSVPTSVIVLSLFLARHPKRGELPGHAIILIGMFLLTQQIEGGWRNPAVLLMIASELCVVSSTLIAELHPINQTEDKRQRAGLTGIMLVVSACAMLILALCFGIASQNAPAVAKVLPDLPWLDDPYTLFNPLLWTLAILVGITLRGPSMFLALTVINRVRTENYLAAMAALPLTSLAFEFAAQRVGWLVPAPTITATTLCGILMVTGSLLVILTRSRTARTQTVKSH
jgi:drug/metabolite transporter (DMT)-like permease